MKRYFLVGLVVGASALYFGWIAFFEAVLGFDLGGGYESNYTVAERYKSPDGKLIAYNYFESGGGAAGWSYSCISLDDSGFCYSDENDIFRIVPSQTELSIEWIDTNTLAISYSMSDHTSVWRNQPQHLEKVTVLFYPGDSKSDRFETEEK